MDNFSKSEKEIYELRKQKISFLNEISDESFPTKFSKSTTISNIVDEHKHIDDGTHTDIKVLIRGRILNSRSFGKLLFFDILDQTGKNQGDEEAHVEDKDYVEALQYALPPTGGLGFGIDRFIMMIVGKTSIREVISFTNLKPEN